MVIIAWVVCCGLWRREERKKKSKTPEMEQKNAENIVWTHGDNSVEIYKKW